MNIKNKNRSFPAYELCKKIYFPWATFTKWHKTSLGIFNFWSKYINKTFIWNTENFRKRKTELHCYYPILRERTELSSYSTHVNFRFSNTFAWAKMDESNCSSQIIYKLMSCWINSVDTQFVCQLFVRFLRVCVVSQPSFYATIWCIGTIFMGGHSKDLSCRKIKKRVLQPLFSAWNEHILFIISQKNIVACGVAVNISLRLTTWTIIYCIKIKKNG